MYGGGTDFINGEKGRLVGRLHRTNCASDHGLPAKLKHFDFFPDEELINVFGEFLSICVLPFAICT